jgi:hypothetical protein
LAAGAVLAAVAPSAQALRLGTTTVPSGATPNGCGGSYDFYVQNATDSAYQYAVPSGGGQISEWSANTTGAAIATPLSLLVLQPSGGSYKVVGFDSEALPSPLPVSGITEFALATPITVTGGELLGLYGASGTVACYFAGGSSIPAAEMISVGATAVAPSIGAIYSPSVSGGSILVNVSAELKQSFDAALSGAATPSTITAGGVSDYSFTVSNGGISAAPATFTDGIPSGLTVLSAVAGSGSCSTAGQTVTCAISSLPPGASVPVSIVVSAAGAGNYADTATVAAGSEALPDRNPANNTAAATLTVSAPSPGAPPPVPQKCKVVGLAGTPLTVAKAVIAALNCKVGKVTSKSSKSVHKGLVLSTSPGSGATLAAGSAVNLVTSSGPPKKKHKTKH